MRQALKESLTMATVCVASLLALPSGAAAETSFSFDMPLNPFAPVLPDELFVETGENRLQKAERVFFDTMGGIGNELGDIFSFPFRDPATFGAYAAGIGALTLVDRPTTIFYQDYIEANIAGFDLPRPGFLPAGISTDAFYIGAAVAGTYAYGIAANDERAQVAALLSTKAVAYSYMTSHLLLKTGFGRRRPVKNLSTHTGPTGVLTTSPFDFFESSGVKFDPSPDATSMPSFHFTMYFSTARVYSGVYDNYWIPYGIAGILAAQSVEGHNHWVSDMVAGALIGTGIGNVLLDNYAERRGSRFSTVTPYVTSNGAGLGVHMSF